MLICISFFVVTMMSHRDEYASSTCRAVHTRALQVHVLKDACCSLLMTATNACCTALFVCVLPLLGVTVLLLLD